LAHHIHSNEVKQNARVWKSYVLRNNVVNKKLITSDKLGEDTLKRFAIYPGMVAQKNSNGFAGMK